MITPAGPGPEGGRVVPAYVLTRGRTRSRGVDLPMESLLTVTDLGRERMPTLQREQRTILDLCAGLTSVIELAAHLDLPLGVARVLVGDLAASGYLSVHLPSGTGQGPDVAVLERLLEGLRAR
jgi:hypothetical protein